MALHPRDENDGLIALTHAVEATLVELAHGRTSTLTTMISAASPGEVFAATSAVASRYLAVATPRTLGLVGAATGALCLSAHKAWFSIGETRWWDPNEALAQSAALAAGGKALPLAKVLASDIVCISVPFAAAETALRRGTHVSVAPGIVVPFAFDPSWLVVSPELPRIAAGYIDGRGGDEISFFIS